MSYADEFLIPKDSFMKKCRKIENLKFDAEDLKMKIELRTKIQEKEREIKIKELEETIMKETQVERERYNMLLSEKERISKEHEELKDKMKEEHEKLKEVIIFN